MFFPPSLQLALAAACVALQGPKSHNGLISFPATRGIKPAGLAKRDEDTSVPLYDESEVSYLIELSIGTPGQSVRVSIDTGSNELWVDPDCRSSNSNSQIEQCLEYGIYDPSVSETAHGLNTTNIIPYGIGTVGIAYFTDNIALPNTSVNVNNVQFGVGVESRQLNEGILGLSFGDKESQANLNYSSFVDQLYLQNLTQTRAFSISLGSTDLDNDGAIIFGGIDTSKYIGPLHTLPILGRQGNDRLHRYWVQLDSVGTTSSNGTNKYENSSLPVVLDTGSTLCSLPQAVVDGMINDLDGRLDRAGQVLVDCAHSGGNRTFDFGFSNFTISIPFSDFIVELSHQYCILGATVSDEIALLGDSFLRSAFVVFDQTNMEISMAAYFNCGESLVAITENGVSGIVGRCANSTDGAAPSENSGSSDGGEKESGNGDANGNGSGNSTGNGAGDATGNGDGNKGAISNTCMPALYIACVGALLLLGLF